MVKCSVIGLVVLLCFSVSVCDLSDVFFSGRNVSWLFFVCCSMCGISVMFILNLIIDRIVCYSCVLWWISGLNFVFMYCVMIRL